MEHPNSRGGVRVSTISLLGCSTSVALAMGPTDEEEQGSQLRASNCWKLSSN